MPVRWFEEKPERPGLKSRWVEVIEMTSTAEMIVTISKFIRYEVYDI